MTEQEGKNREERNQKICYTNEEIVLEEGQGMYPEQPKIYDINVNICVHPRK